MVTTPPHNKLNSCCQSSDDDLEKCESSEELLSSVPELKCLTESKELSIVKLVSATDAISLGTLEGNHEFTVKDKVILSIRLSLNDGP